MTLMIFMSNPNFPWTVLQIVTLIVQAISNLISASYGGEGGAEHLIV